MGRKAKSAAGAEPTRSEVVARLEAGAGGAAAVPLAKAYFIGEDSGSTSRALLDQDKQSNLFNSRGALPPVYDPNLLTLIFENSSTLRPNVDSYVTNIDSFGHMYDPVLDLNSQEATEKVRDALRIETKKEPSDEEVKARIETLKVEIRAERAFLENFFENCTPDMPFSGPEGLRGLTRQDIEVIGSGYWEVLRNELNEVAIFNYLPGRSIRIMPVDRQTVEVTVRRRVSLLSTKEQTVRKRFRRYIQISETNDRVVYFKEFGDPRFVDANTGNIYQTLEEATTKAKDDNREFVPATEILGFKISSPRTPYGVPRWIGALLAVLGTRQAEEVNFLYFENRSVPPLAVLVSGGRLNTDSVGKLEDYIANQIRGKRNFHKILILEADTANGDPNSGKTRIVLQPLTEAQQKDGTFQQYDERNADKVGQAFRLPRLLRGDVRDFNRSTAEASVDFAEIQVFGPIRQQFDWMMNKLIFPSLGVKYHSFKSNAPTVRDPEALADMIQKLAQVGILIPSEGRKLARGVFNQDLEDIRAAWTAQPIALTLAGMRVSDDLNTEEDEAAEFDTGASLDEFNANGGMSAGGAGATQAALGVDQTKRRVRLNKRRASILKRVHAQLVAAERDEFFKSKAEIVKVPEAFFHSLFVGGGAPGTAR